MGTFLVVLIVAGSLLVLAGLFLKPLWRVGVRPLYRHPEAQEPSKLGWGARSSVMIVAGVAVIIGGATLLVQAQPTPPSPSAAARANCTLLRDQVGSPSTATLAEKAVNEAAAEGGYTVERKDESTESVVDLPSGETKITIDIVTWTVTHGSETVASFTWTSSDSTPGRFRAHCDGEQTENE